MLPPQHVAELRDSLSHELSASASARVRTPALVTNVDVRRHVRQVLEAFAPACP